MASYRINYDVNTWLNILGKHVVLIQNDVHLDEIYYYDAIDVEYEKVSIDQVSSNQIYWVRTNKQGELLVNEQKIETLPTQVNKNISRNHFYIIAADKADIPHLLRKLNSATVIDYKQLPTNPDSLANYLKKY